MPAPIPTSSGALDEVLFTLGQSLRRLRISIGDESDFAYAIGSGFWQLVLLGERGEERVSEIAFALNLDISTVSRQLKLLESRGLIERTPDKSDGRVSKVRLTELGTNVLHQLVQARLAVINDALSSWKKTDVDALITLLDRFSRDLGSSLTDPDICSVPSQGENAGS
ncbi:MarR family transcriptional regulator [Ferrimicrobium sp.]|uniref:MarR family winged helix-turn-helix transcriptional regulator n=1 Tax=Ferrimicrobium sp. TaxID=2926050 RepID=UPI0026103D86|nr:MarR family transcriptional regulator [Ferrimicrobium sp.]